NFGPVGTGNVDVQGIVELVIAAWGSGNWQTVESKNDRMHEASCLKLDVTKANSLLAWRPVFSVSEAVFDTIAWYKAFYDKSENMLAFTLNQIHEYTYRAGKKGLAWAYSGECL
ncbi:MAG: CDP-glucose 4,6-dehydratase, partial [Methanobacteriota archaeon]